jgi:hypothetical protein
MCSEFNEDDSQRTEIQTFCIGANFLSNASNRVSNSFSFQSIVEVLLLAISRVSFSRVNGPKSIKLFSIPPSNNQAWPCSVPKKKMARFLCDEKYRNVIDELQERGWSLVTATGTEGEKSGEQIPKDCQLIWKNLTKTKFQSIFDRYVNHFRGSSQMSNKVLNDSFLNPI